MPVMTESKGSTYDMLKSFSPARGSKVPKAADASIIITDAKMQQARNKIAAQTEISDDIINNLGKTCNAVQAVAEHTKGEESQPVTPDFIASINEVIEKTNGDSGKLHDLDQSLAGAIENINVSVNEVLALFTQGNMTPDELIQTLKEQYEKAKGITETNPDSVSKQVNQLATSCKHNEHIVNRVQKEVHSMMGRHNVNPQAVNRMQASEQTSTAPAASEPTAQAESSNRSPRSR